MRQMQNLFNAVLHSLADEKFFPSLAMPLFGGQKVFSKPCYAVVFKCWPPLFGGRKVFSETIEASSTLQLPCYMVCCALSATRKTI